MAKKKRPRAEASSPANSDTMDEGESTPLIFISHDSRDADLAEAFAMLLTDASGGILKSFRSSDKSGTQGIEFGTEWYRAIMQKLDEATDVVALLTPRSLNRPWILYETGVAKGKLESTVLGLALGVSLDSAATGPFAQFQNSGDDEESLTKLVLQLIRRHPDAAPREAAIRRQVQAFKEQVAELLKTRESVPHVEKPRADENAVAKLFEEIKLQIRDLPEILTIVRQMREMGGADRRRSFDIVVGDKTIRVDLAGTWQSQFKRLGWPEETPQVLELQAEIASWFAQDPSRLGKRGTITLSQGSGKVIVRPNGVLLNQFKVSPKPLA